MNDLALARTLHVLAVLLWMGGVAFVTTVLLPAVRTQVPAEQRVAFFEAVEGRFAWQARGTTALAGATGFTMVHQLDAWSWFLDPARWYLHAMVAVWVLFTLMLFVLEPLVLHDWFHRAAARDPEGTFRLIRRLHHVLLTLGLLTTAGAVAGAHGWLWW